MEDKKKKVPPKINLKKSNNNITTKQERQVKNLLAGQVANNNENLITIIISVIIAIVLFVGVYFGLSSAFETEKYYVLNTNVAARTQIKPQMLTEVVVSKGGSPHNAITLAEVKQGSIFTQYPLMAGDILSASNTGAKASVTNGIPDDWVITSFSINANSAVGGNIDKGNYFDIIGVKSDGAKYLYTNVLALDVNRSQQSKDGSLDTTIQYIIGVPPQEAPKLHHALNSYEIKLVLSPKTVEYEKRDVVTIDGIFKSDNSKLVDLYKGTDNKFRDIIRDVNGRPVTLKNCMVKDLINPQDLCKDVLKQAKEQGIDLEELRKEQTSNKEEQQTNKTKETTSETTLNENTTTTTEQKETQASSSTSDATSNTTKASETTSATTAKQTTTTTKAK